MNRIWDGFNFSLTVKKSTVLQMAEIFMNPEYGMPPPRLIGPQSRTIPPRHVLKEPFFTFI